MHGRPHTGAVADCMRRTRAAYHYAVRNVRRREAAIIQENFSKSVLENRTRDFWSEVRKLKNSSKYLSNNIDGTTDRHAIADMFAEKYDGLYTNVPYDSVEMAEIVRNITDGIDGYSSDCIITVSDVAEAVSGLKTAKHDGYAGLSTDYVIYACDELFVHIALLFSAMLVHGLVFDDLTTSSIIPIPKGKNMNCSESCNYRAIALSSIFGKLIDRIILIRYADKLITSQHHRLQARLSSAFSFLPERPA